MISTIAIVVLVIDDLRLRGKLYGVMKQVTAFEKQFELGIVNKVSSILSAIKAKL